MFSFSIFLNWWTDCDHCSILDEKDIVIPKFFIGESGEKFNLSSAVKPLEQNVCSLVDFCKICKKKMNFHYGIKMLQLNFLKIQTILFIFTIVKILLKFFYCKI